VEPPGPFPAQDRFAFEYQEWRTRTSSDGKAGTDGAGVGSFEWSRYSPASAEDRARASGLLVEWLQGREVDGPPGNEHRSRALEVGAFYLMGQVLGPRLDPEGGFRGYRLRTDFGAGMRVVSTGEEKQQPNDPYGDDSSSAGALEFAVLFRLQYSPVEGIVLLARGDLGAMPLLVVNEATAQAVLGLRLEPIRGLGLEGGWRFLGSSSEDLFGGGPRVSFSGPWIGLRLEF
jgi:hypothetical protein